MSPRGDYTGLEKLNENVTNKKSIVQLFSIGVSDFKLIFDFKFYFDNKIFKI
jgi:hypothetical protein